MMTEMAKKGLLGAAQASAFTNVLFHFLKNAVNSADIENEPVTEIKSIYQIGKKKKIEAF